MKRYNIDLEEILHKYAQVDGDLEELKLVLMLESDLYKLNLNNEKLALYKSLVWKEDESDIFDEEFQDHRKD